MERAIVGFYRDAEGHWVADLECGHGQHTRHDPPLVERPWVQTEAGRLSALGRPLDCLRCDRREWPEGLEAYQRTPLFDAASLPEGLRQQHSTKKGVWARIHVVSGRVRYRVEGPAPTEEVLEAGTHGTVAPEVPHSLSPLGAVQVYVEFHRPRSGAVGPPDHLRGITPDWLGTVLGQTVRAAHFQAIGVFSSEIWRVRLECAPSTRRAPESLVVKCPKSVDGDRPTRGFDEESRFYAEIAPHLAARTPDAYHVGPDPVSGTPILLMEDVSNIEPISFLDGVGDEHARLALAALAELHARESTRVLDLDWIPHLGDADERRRFGERFDRSWQQVGSRLRDRYGEGVGRLGDKLVGRVDARLAQLGEDATLLHGDAHFENCPLRPLQSGGHEVVLLDWASVARGSPGLDVAVFIVMSLPVEARRRREEELVAHHARAARRAGLHGDADPWQAYRLGALHRFALMVDIASGQSEQALEKWNAGSGVVERCLLAGDDLLGAEHVT